jgi:hypothetical protein
MMFSVGKQYHRGHVVPHTLGGGTDINLVPQLGKINIVRFGRWRNLPYRLREPYVSHNGTTAVSPRSKIILGRRRPGWIKDVSSSARSLISEVTATELDGTSSAHATVGWREISLVIS